MCVYVCVDERNHVLQTEKSDWITHLDLSLSFIIFSNSFNRCLVEYGIVKTEWKLGSVWGKFEMGWERLTRICSRYKQTGERLSYSVSTPLRLLCVQFVQSNDNEN